MNNELGFRKQTKRRSKARDERKENGDAEETESSI